MACLEIERLFKIPFNLNPVPSEQRATEINIEKAIGGH
jgi:hypothetical protein